MNDDVLEMDGECDAIVKKEEEKVLHVETEGFKNYNSISTSSEKDGENESEEYENLGKQSNDTVENKVDNEGTEDQNQEPIGGGNTNDLIIISEWGEGDSQDANEVVEDLGFTFDTTPTEEKGSEPVPLFKRFRKGVLKEQEEVKPENDFLNSNKIKNVCFNCDGDHALKDCELPRNMKKINKARKLKNMKVERYHIDVEQRFAHIKPGKVSQKLRTAMGLNISEIPPMFYRMRVLKYPPAWLEEAKVAHSGINLFGSKGCTILGSDDDEGELDESKLKYDLSKIIDFPGFNVHPGVEYFDDYNYQGVPPFSFEDSKENFIKSFALNAAKQGYKRKKLKIDVEQTENIVDEVTNVADMEVDEKEFEEISQNLPYFLKNQPPPPAEEPPQTPPPPEDEGEIRETELSSCGSNACVDTNCQDLSLSALEVKQAEILKLLNSSDGMEIEENKSKIESPIKTILASKDEEICQTNKTDENDQSVCENLMDENSFQTDDESKINEKSSSNILKSSIVGTPILKFSPYEKLPPGHLFKEGVSDVINFENLPDSVGKYDQMRVLLFGVRKKIVEINQMPDD